MNSTHQYQDLIQIFNQCFAESFNTQLVKGESEPIYLPADSDCDFHRVVFAHGFFASALHEIAHWCLAGPQRRLLPDYGYWYSPDGRDAAKQQAFEQVEIKPQALEWMFSVAAAFVFNISCDNLDGDYEPDRASFQQRVQQQVMKNLANPIPERANIFLQALQQFYGTAALRDTDFNYLDGVCNQQ